MAFSNTHRSKLILLALFVSLHLVAAAKPSTEQNPCSGKATCSQCIQTKTCAWCLQPQANFEGRERCFQPSYDSLTTCPEEFTYNPDSQLTETINKELTRRKRLDAGAGYEDDSAAAAAGYQQSSASNYSYSSSSYRSSSGSSSSSSSNSMSWRSEGEIVQIKPQRVNLRLRISEWMSGVVLSWTMI